MIACISHEIENEITVRGPDSDVAVEPIATLARIPSRTSASL
jgi:hypothetical protein